MYRAALVGLKPQRSNDSVMHVAVSLAKQRGLQLSALAVIDPDAVAPTETTPIGAAAFKVHRDDVVRKRAHENALAALGAFEGLCSETGVDCSTMYREGAVEKVFSLESQTADLLIVGHAGDSKACSRDREDVVALHEILRASSRPCLVATCVPVEVERVTVAFDGSLPSARTLYDFAVSGLWQERPIDVLSIAEEGPLADETSQRGARYLRLHGYEATAHPLVTKYDIPENILRFVEESGAGALVMGTHGKPRWHELVFGTTTRSILRAVMVPVFLSH